MGQIVKRKKKGRPSKADLARRAELLTPEATPAAEESDRRRSMRRRNVRYNNFIDYDDYLDEFEDFFEEEGAGPLDDEEEEDEARRKEKKLELVLNLHAQKQGNVGTRKKRRKRAGAARVFNTRVSEPRMRAASEEDYEEDEQDDEGERKNNASDEANEDEDEEDYGNNGNDEDEDEIERRVRKREHTTEDESVPGTPSDPKKQFPLPDKRTLELILDKLQKKDIYGVYAEPVDLEELPDYLDVIDNPMDFATVRKKLESGAYQYLGQLESDVILICSNAMQYNSSDTVYYKQARTIQDLAKKKFQKLRVKTERSDKEQKTNPSRGLKMKKPLVRQIHEPIGSDFSSGATLATRFENPIVDNNDDYQAEDGKGSAGRLGRKPVVLEDRRSTYNNANRLPNAGSVLSTFDGEAKQLVAVGLHADFAYGRSLARFAANLGPVAWKIASQKVELCLPSGCKYGRGWVGEYEPPPTPVLMLDTRKQSDTCLFSKVEKTYKTAPKTSRPLKAVELNLPPPPSSVDSEKHAPNKFETDVLKANGKTASDFFHRGGLTDPVEAMRLSTQKAQIQAENDAGNASVTAARAWMSIGSGSHNESPKGQLSVESLFNPTRQPSQVPHGQFGVRGTTPFEKSNVPFQSFMPPVDQNHPMMFGMQGATWRGLGPAQARQKSDTSPPDLNIGFQSPGSPVRPAVGDSQHPDLALQL